jgi:class 3 adenylate cyclase
MDAPPIQYVRTDDGVNIAYFDVGSGTPLIFMPNLPYSHIEQEWQSDPWFERLAEHCRLIRYDGRGNGLSDRTTDDLSADALRRDLDAVVEATGVDRFALFAMLHASLVAIRYATDQPERLSTLFLWHPYATGSDTADEPYQSAFTEALHNDFELYTFMAAGMAFGWEDHEHMANWGMRILQRATTAEMVRRTFGALSHESVEALLPSVRSEAVVLHRRDNRVTNLRLTRRVVAAIPGARLAILEGRSLYPFAGDGEAVLRVLQEHLESPSLAPGAAQNGDSGPFRTILFTDVVASTPLLAQLKDAKMREIMHDHDAILTAAIADHGGRVIKEIGDAFMADFAVPSAAVDCAIAMQQGIQAQFAGSDVPIRLRIGINAGEPVEEDGDLHGASVVIAKRLESAAPVNGILIADGVKQLLAGKDFAFADQGDVALKGFDDPVRAWTVEWA